MGPLIDQKAAHRVEQWIAEAVAQGARVLLGGKRMGSVVEATVLSNVTPDDESVLSGSVRAGGDRDALSPLDEAIDALNASEYGLQAGVFTQDVNKVFHAFRHLEVGAVLANEIPTFRAEHMPYGGVKDSGLGREGLKAAIEEMTEPRVLVVNLRPPSAG